MKEGGDNIGGKLFSEINVAALKGYCGVLTPAGIPTLWDAFQKTKELASHRHNLRFGMQKWSKQIGLDIDKAPFFTENQSRISSVSILTRARPCRPFPAPSGGY